MNNEETLYSDLLMYQNSSFDLKKNRRSMFRDLYKQELGLDDETIEIIMNGFPRGRFTNCTPIIITVRKGSYCGEIIGALVLQVLLVLLSNFAQ